MPTSAKLKTFFTISTLLAILASAFLILPTQASSDPQLLISWHAASYTPTWYAGRALPSPGTPILATVDLINSKGQIADLSRTQIYWYVDHTYAAGGIGLQNMSVPAPDSVGGTVAIEARLPNYQDVVVLKTVSVPVVAPKAVIDIPFPDSTIFGKEGILNAWPFFFGITNPDLLNYSWQVNNSPVKNTENPEFLRLTTTSNKPSQATVDLSIQNPSRPQEGAATENIVVIGK